MELRKFPVTAPDGTEYRVKIEEEPANVFESASAKVTVYTKRKQIGFRKLGGTRYFDGHSAYTSERPDYVTLASITIERLVERLAIKAEAAARKQAAVERFDAWDGRVAR
ncbi:hypothetical protein NST07_25970 [Paenibacillus sp. FSL L8-0340]|uniref:hypothetical protein n=1 Tax=Paenibacillus sp. FSL L8-0340 TaxID=2954685 RepID=UPI003158C90C